MDFVAPSAPRKRPLDTSPSSSSSSSAAAPSSSSSPPGPRSKIPTLRAPASSAYPPLRFAYGSPARPFAPPPSVAAGGGGRPSTLPPQLSPPAASSSTPANANAPPGHLRQGFFDVLDVQRKSPKKASAKARRFDFDAHELNTPAAVRLPATSARSHDVLMVPHDDALVAGASDHRGGEWSAADHVMQFHEPFGRGVDDGDDSQQQQQPVFVGPSEDDVNPDVVMKLVGPAAAHHQSRQFEHQVESHQPYHRHHHPQQQQQQRTQRHHEPYQQQQLYHQPQQQQQQVLIDQKEIKTPSATRVSKPVPKRIFTPRVSSMEQAFPTVSGTGSRVALCVQRSRY